MSDHCLFCTLAQSGLKFWENELFFSVLDIFPTSPGHALVIPKQHIVDFKDLPHSHWVIMQEAILAVVNKIETTDLRSLYERMVAQPLNDGSKAAATKVLNHPRLNTKPDAYNHTINDGTAAGRQIDHLHWHIVPRYEGFVPERGG